MRRELLVWARKGFKEYLTTFMMTDGSKQHNYLSNAAIPSRVGKRNRSAMMQEHIATQKLVRTCCPLH
eukprot:2142983-Amphidinium_carterae.1